MGRNALFLLVGGLAVGLAIVGYLFYQEQQSGVEIEISPDGVKIDSN